MITIDINREDTIACLRKFGLSDSVKEWRLLADGPDHPVPYDVIRKIIYVELGNGKKYVVKFVREPVFTVQIIENQCAFSDLLAEHGLETPGRLRKDGRYCVSYEKENLTMDVYIEEWVGEKIPHLSLELFGGMGSLLGKMHQISAGSGFRIGFSLLYNEITQRDTSLERLWKNGGHSFIPEDVYASILQIYNRRLALIKEVWTKLPKAAVQGDIYSCNNIALGDGGLIVYDFNLAGDEVLIGDILLCWFRTIFDERIAEDLKTLSREQMWAVFIKAYQAERPLTVAEKACLPDVYAILGVVYYTKLLNFWRASGEGDKAREEYPYLLELLKTQELPFVS